MITPKEIIEEIKTLKDVINRNETRGAENANYILFSSQKCDSLMTAINEVINDRAKATEDGE